MEAREERGSILSLYRPAIDGDQMEEKPQTPMTGRLPRTATGMPGGDTAGKW